MGALLNHSATSLLRFKGRLRLPVLHQSEAAECGLACLAMVAAYHGFESDLGSLRRRFPASGQGVNLRQLIDLAEKLSLVARPLRLEPSALNQLQLPCILHWDLNHFVVLNKIGSKAIEIHDPALGLRRLTRVEFDRHFTGVALELLPTTDFQPAKRVQSLGFAQLYSRVCGLKRSLGQVLALSLLLQLFGIAAPFYMQTVVDDVLLRADSNLLLVLALGFGLLLLIQTLTQSLRELVILQLANRLNIGLAANLFRHLVRLPMDYFAKRHLGDVVSRFGSLAKLRELLTTGLVSALVDGLMALMTLAAMWLYDARLTLVVLLVAGLYIALRLVLYRPLRQLTEQGLVAQASHDSHFMESVRAIQTIKLCQRENDRQGQWLNKLAASLNVQISLARWQVGFGAANRLLFGVEHLLVIYLAAQAVMGNVMSVGMLYAFISYKTRFVEAVDNLVTQFIELKMLGLHLDRLGDIALTPAEVVDPPESLSPVQPVRGSIDVKNLSYRYGEDSPFIFQNVNFTIEPGETVAITGPSGCGKTTLLKCLMGLMQPSSGEIRVDGIDIKQLPHYRSQIAGVMQDDQLLAGAIADNITCFDPQPDLPRVVHCAQMACIHEDILRLPMQYHTLVGDLGATLSGGQKQRIVLARALYRAPRILFMDEATSHLDVARESLVNDQIKRLPITRVLVAHRPETVASAGKRIELNLDS